ncbi:LysR family transcriptional regulator [Nonomuraea sp. MG754425]|uniref:LysR family transcriptional regulator n=1 Tax=Nonomuraea sp. MG754425 TaxID=2570319 RepID=UPI001F1E25E8|nr:LysR family transcriptional regulator [Nonomuraea sp. MG754425]MCF6468613.1 LysR family transcriptional regulator [Nonomuraea sp. MG754425]
MTFTQLRVLRAVARTGSMTRAAEELATTQSAVSHALRALERELGVVLLVRGGHGVSLTAVGRAVCHRATLILNQLEALEQEASAARGQDGGALRVGVIPSANARLLPPILRAFGRAHPQVRLTVIEGSDGEVLEWLRTGAADVATLTDAAAGVSPELVTEPLARDRLLAVLPTGHDLSAGPAVPVAELARHPFIMSTGGCEPLIRSLGVRWRCHYRVRDTGSILAMVAEGLGVSIMPELSLPARLTGVAALPLEPETPRTILLGLPADPLPAAVAFAALARAHTPGPGGT